MKRILAFLPILLFPCTKIIAQNKQPGFIPDINKLRQMSPVQLEQYKKQMLNQLSAGIKTTAEKANITIDETLLPDYEIKPPVKDLQRLASIPKQTPSLAELILSLRKSKQQLESLTPASYVDAVNKIAARQNPAQLQASSIAEWYGDNPVAALLLSMHSVTRNPDTAISWNNLAALFNMSGLEHKAVPILQHWLQKLPGNSLLLNNLGQAYYGLGDLRKAEDYLRQCLEQDSLNPEANRTMAMMCIIKHEPQKAQEYAKKEAQITQRESTQAIMKKENLSFNLFVLYERRGDVPKTNFFEDIGLGKFEMPDFPENSDESGNKELEHGEFRKAAAAEMLFWENACILSPEEQKKEGQRIPGMYSRKVERLLHDLYEEYENLLPLFSEDDLAFIKTQINEYGTELSAIKCPEAPAGASMDVWAAYQEKCCQLKKKITDKFIKQFNAFVKSRTDRAIVRWKTYLNQLINIVTMSPEAGNRVLVYKMVAMYFEMMIRASSTAQFLHPPTECGISGLTPAQTDSVIESSRKIDFRCPPSFNFEIDLQVAKLKGDCEKFSVEAGKLWLVSLEKNFKKGTSTIAGGVGISQGFGKAGKASLKQWIYITFDNNNNFSDLGLKGTAEVAVNSNPIKITEEIGTITRKIGGIEGGYTLGINSGLQTSVKGKGILANFVNISYPFK